MQIREMILDLPVRLAESRENTRMESNEARAGVSGGHAMHSNVYHQESTSDNKIRPASCQQSDEALNLMPWIDYMRAVGK